MQMQFDESRWPDLTRFRRACLHGHHAEMQKIADLTHNWYGNENPDGLTMEHLAALFQVQYYASTNNLAQLKLVIGDHPSFVNHGWTAQRWLPLTQACTHGNRELIEYLLAEGADPTLTVGDPGEQVTVVEMAKYNGHGELAQWLEALIAKGSDG